MVVPLHAEGYVYHPGVSYGAILDVEKWPRDS